MSSHSGAKESHSLQDLGWSEFFASQIQPGEADLAPCRIATVHRDRVTATSEDGIAQLALPVGTSTAELAVGDWVLIRPETRLLHRRLTRKTLLQRQVAGSDVPQLAAANVDTLFIVTSCNTDWNAARLERYLALANEANVEPVVVLSKADTAADLTQHLQKTAALQRGLAVVAINARSREAAIALARWCGAGQTVTLVGSSGVGKSTLVNTLVGLTENLPQVTGSTREHDAKGRHTTTSRSLHSIAGAAWLIDTPGVRSLQVSEVGHGVEAVFAEITELAAHCHFRDCNHETEPGCAVQAALRAGDIDPERFARWRKLKQESRTNKAGKESSSRSRTTASRRRRN